MRAWIALAILLMTGVSQAEPTGKTLRYGDEIVAFDAASIATFATGVALLSKPDSDFYYVGVFAAIAGGAGYVLGGPAVHMRHHRNRTGRIDFALRVLAPSFGAGIGIGIITCPDNEPSCSKKTIATILGGALGIAAVSVIDIGYLAKVEIRPYVAPTSDGAALGLVGSF